MAQRIVVPRGTVNPGETSVIEIPHHYQASNLVIASPRMASPASVRQSSPVPGAAAGGLGNLDVSRISRPSPRGRQHVSELCPCPQSPVGNVGRAYHSDPEGRALRWGPGARGQASSGRSDTYESTPSFVFPEDESVYDDTMIRQRRDHQRREQVADPEGYHEFQYGAHGGPRDRSEDYRTPEAQRGAAARFKPKLQVKSLRHGMDDEEMHEMKCMMQNVHFSHDLRIYQKARRNLIRQAAKITHSAFKKMENMTSVSKMARITGGKTKKQPPKPGTFRRLLDT